MSTKADDVQRNQKVWFNFDSIFTERDQQVTDEQILEHIKSEIEKNKN